MKNGSKTKRSRNAVIASPVDQRAAFELAMGLLRVAGIIGKAEAVLAPNERLASSIAILAIAKIMKNISMEATDGLTQTKIALVSYAIAQDICHSAQLNLDTRTDEFIVAASADIPRDWDERWFSKRGMRQMDKRANTLVDALRRFLLDRKRRRTSHPDDFTGVEAAARVCSIGLHPLLLFAADLRSKGYDVDAPPQGYVDTTPRTSPSAHG